MIVQMAPRILFLLGVGFLVANLRIGVDTLRFFRRRSQAELVWRGNKPRYYGMQLGLGVVLGILLVADAVFLHRPAPQLFGVAMMFVYYGYALPLSLKIGRGFYADGIWSENGFVAYENIGAVSWREGKEP